MDDNWFSLRCESLACFGWLNNTVQTVTKSGGSESSYLTRHQDQSMLPIENPHIIRREEAFPERFVSPKMKLATSATAELRMPATPPLRMPESPNSTRQAEADCVLGLDVWQLLLQQKKKRRGIWFEAFQDMRVHPDKSNPGTSAPTQEAKITTTHELNNIVPRPLVNDT